MSKSHITPVEVRTYRERAGQTAQEMAAEFNATPAQVRGWEDGTVRVPRHVATTIQVVLRNLEREDALVAAGFPPCDWAQACLEGAEADASDEAHRRIEALNAHAAACPVCQARARYVREHLAHTLEPDSFAGRLFDRFYDAVHRLPRPLRPAAYGAAIVAVITFLRALVMLPTGAPGPSLLEIIGVVLLAAYAGAVGGLAYHAARGRLRRFGKAEPYLSGILVIGVYLIALALPMSFLDPQMRGDPALSLAIGGGVTVLFGLMIGHMWFRHV